MGILRADLLTHSQLSNEGGSIVLDGTTDFIQVPSGEAWRIGSANGAHKSVTIEWWIYLNTTSGYHNAFDINYTSGLVIEGVNGVYSLYGGGQTLINEGILDAATANRWYHYALVIHGGPAATPKSIFLYRDGKLSGAGKIASNVGLGSNSNNLSIGARQSNGANSLNGHISNFRWSDEVVYNSEFTVPKFNLKARPSTLLLCCQSSTSATEAAVSATGSVTASGNATHSSFNPGLKDDITDTGVVFDGVTTFDSQAYMVPPGGNTRERNRGRGLIMGGAVSPGSTNTTQIKYFDIASGGITEDFGQTTGARRATGSLSSSTRGLMGGGFVTTATSPHTVSNVIDFVTIANTANATDFGDMQQTGYSYATASNQTRGLFAGGYRPNNSAVVNTIDLITIATTGNASNFGDLTRQARSFSGAESTTRGVFFGGAPSTQDTIDFVTFSTTGDATDFGNLTVGRDYVFGSSSSTRAVMGGGRDPNTTNIIDFITIASAGNATDFGDLTSTSYYFNAATGNSTRAVWVGTSTIVNSMEFVTIATLGNASDFGDQNGTAQHSNGAASDSHGGIE